MSELGVLRITRVIRRAGAAARGGGLSATQVGLGGLGAHRMAEIHPAVAAIMVATMAFAETEPFLAHALGQAGAAPISLFDAPALVNPQVTADRQRQWVLQRIYGSEVGNEIYQKEWSHRSDEV